MSLPTSTVDWSQIYLADTRRLLDEHEHLESYYKQRLSALELDWVHHNSTGYYATQREYDYVKQMLLLNTHDLLCTVQDALHYEGSL